MATLNFPKDPVFGDVYEFGSYTYKWDGEKWKTIGTGVNPANELRKEVFPKLDITNTYAIEALRRSYAEAGYNLVSGSFGSGGVLESSTDVLLNETDGKGYAWNGTFPKVVSPGTDPAAVAGFVMRSDAGLRSEITPSLIDSLRRSYADTGFNLVEGSFEEGGTLANINDVLLYKSNGRAYSGPSGAVPPGTNPSSGSFVDRSVAVSSRISVTEHGGVTNYASDSYQAVNTANQLAYTKKQPLSVDGLFAVSQSIQSLAGASIKGTNGRLTSNQRSALKATAVIDSILNVSAMSYGDVYGVSLLCDSKAGSGIKGKNVFFNTVENVRVDDQVYAGFELVNDGTGIGCYGNRYINCAGSGGEAVFRMNPVAGNINLILYQSCAATDSPIGFDDTGAQDGRNISYRDVDAEKCAVGIKTKARGFIVDGGYFEFNEKSIITYNLAGTQQQSGLISNPTILGSYNFSGAPNAYQSVGIELDTSYCLNIIGGWYQNLKTAIVVDANSRNVLIANPFFGNRVEKRIDGDLRNYLLIMGPQVSESVGGYSGTSTSVADVREKLIYVDLGNNAKTLQINTANTDYFDGFGHEIFIMKNTAQTGALTVQLTGGGTFFGQFKGARQSGTTSVVLDTAGDKIKVTKLGSTWIIR